VPCRYLVSIERVRDQLQAPALLSLPDDPLDDRIVDRRRPAEHDSLLSLDDKRLARTLRDQPPKSVRRRQEAERLDIEPGVCNGQHDPMRRHYAGREEC
jgi:hypothetical protein